MAYVHFTNSTVLNQNSLEVWNTNTWIDQTETKFPV